jgi:hypothetical protein
MILHVSEKHDVIMKSARDYRGKTIYMVIYGLQVSKLESEKAALSEYTSCVRHAMACESK